MTAEIDLQEYVIILSYIYFIILFFLYRITTQSL